MVRLISRDRGCSMNWTTKGKMVRLIHFYPISKLKFQKSVNWTIMARYLLYPKTRRWLDNDPKKG